jgi:predicted transcriptional regulator
MTTTANKQSLQSESLHARIPSEILDDIDRLANAFGRSRNWVFNEALKQYLDMQKWQIALIKERFREAKKSKAEFTPHNDVVKKQRKRLREKLRV